MYSGGSHSQLTLTRNDHNMLLPQVNCHTYTARNRAITPLPLFPSSLPLLTGTCTAISFMAPSPHACTSCPHSMHCKQVPDVANPKPCTNGILHECHVQLSRDPNRDFLCRTRGEQLGSSKFTLRTLLSVWDGPIERDVICVCA